MTQPTFEDVIDKFFIETHCMVVRKQKLGQEEALTL